MDCQSYVAFVIEVVGTLDSSIARGAMSDLSPLSGQERKLDFGAISSVDDPALTA